MLRRVALIATGTLLLGMSGLAAQDYTLPPLSGEIKLADGFVPDPHTTEVQAGGPIALGANLAPGCIGFVSDAPNLRVYYTAGANPLVIRAESATDLVLAVNTPDGVWQCNDDTDGSNPALTFDAPQSGQYDIWVGTYSDTGSVSATLILASAAAGGALDFNLPAINGVTELRAGFTPDPFLLDVEAGGEAAADTVNENCFGFTTPAPTFSLQYTAGSFPLYIAALADDDTLLVINDPSGNWFCDDDSGGYPNPLVTFDAPQTGRYDIWVATFGGTTPATLYISETAPPEAAVDDTFLNWDLTPVFGEANLEAGFTPRPHEVPIEAGGPVAVTADTGEGCTGYATAAPTYRIQYASGGVPLAFTVLAEGDTTLIIADPEGNYICNDDLDGFNPGITFDLPMDGQYDIWVGTYGEGQTVAGTLTIAELGEPITTLDFNLDPLAGEVTLEAGFVPDPYTMAVTAGGPISAYTAAEDTCTGYVTAGPTVRLFYTAGAFPLAIWAEAADADLTIVINDPNGDWHCNDDAGEGLNPAVLFEAPIAGQYDIWIGTYSQGGTAEATLLISETIDPTALEASMDGPVSPGGVGALDFAAAPIFGEVTLPAGFTPDPTTVAIDAGGEIPAEQAADPSCRGFVTSAATYRLTYNAGAYPLAIWAESADRDLTLVINGPDGTWICDDDSGEGLTPAILLDAPLAGQYDIWVGTYGGGAAPATLFISEITNPIEDTTPIVSPPPPPSLPPLPPSGAAGQLDVTLPPVFGETTLVAGFVPDPHAVDVQAGGEINAEIAADPACRGTVSAAPSFRLFYTAATAPLIFKAMSEIDTTLVINLPDGTWLCDDDGGEGLNPLVTIAQPTTGQYDIWVGTYFGGALQAATLLITEIAGSP